MNRTKYLQTKTIQNVLSFSFLDGKCAQAYIQWKVNNKILPSKLYTNILNLLL